MSVEVVHIGERAITASKEELIDGLRNYRATIHVNLSYREASYALVEVYRDGEWKACYYENLAKEMWGEDDSQYKLDTKWIEMSIEDLLEEAVELDEADL